MDAQAATMESEALSMLCVPVSQLPYPELLSPQTPQYMGLHSFLNACIHSFRKQLPEPLL